ncbi:MAG: hypothetical protein KGI60_00195 [Patescibacteria group bacterium]|nr:hypothetical protein [Patescibacteria group bacterium]
MADKKPAKGGGGTNNSALELLVFGALALVVLTWLSSYLKLFFDPIGFLLGIRNYFAPWFLHNIWWVEVVSALISAILLYSTISMMRRTHYSTLKREQVMEYLAKEKVPHHRSLKLWNQIRRRLDSENQNDLRLAILECDHLLNEILKMSGYLGRMDEKLKLLDPSQLSNIEDVKRAHALRDKIAQDPTYAITQEEARAAADIYGQAFKEFNLIRED